MQHACRRARQRHFSSKKSSPRETPPANNVFMVINNCSCFSGREQCRDELLITDHPSSYLQKPTGRARAFCFDDPVGNCGQKRRSQAPRCVCARYFAHKVVTSREIDRLRVGCCFKLPGCSFSVPSVPSSARKLGQNRVGPHTELLAKVTGPRRRLTNAPETAVMAGVPSARIYIHNGLKLEPTSEKVAKKHSLSEAKTTVGL